MRDEEEEEGEEEEEARGVEQPIVITCNKEGVVSNKQFSVRTDSIIISLVTGVRSGILDKKWIRHAAD
jgi:hypothetical protein